MSSGPDMVALAVQLLAGVGGVLVLYEVLVVLMLVVARLSRG